MTDTKKRCPNAAAAACARYMHGRRKCLASLIGSQKEAGVGDTPKKEAKAKVRLLHMYLGSSHPRTKKYVAS